MYITALYTFFFVITASPWALLRSPTAIDIPGDLNPPTVFNPDGTPYEPDSTSSASQMTHKANKWKSPTEKYFHESTFDAHYDGRFASIVQPPETRTNHLRALLRTYLATMHSLGAETWIMHGSLLGWWWNRRIMPWDSDIDVQVSEPALSYLASHHNMSVYSFQDVSWLGEVNMGTQEVPKVTSDDGGKQEGQETSKRTYLLEINPHWKNGSYADKYNVIDARWIDMQTGLYIDITTLRLNASSPVPGTLYCKDKHRYLAHQIFPLRTSTFEGVPAKIPYAYQELLAEEYGSESLVERMYRKEGHWFDTEKMEWVRMNNGEGDGTFRQYDSYEEQREKARKKKAGRKDRNRLIAKEKG